MGLPLSDRRLSFLTDDRLSSSMGLPFADRRLSGLTDDRRSSTITAKTFNSSDMGYVSEVQPRPSLVTVSSRVQGGNGVFNQVLPKHRRNSSPASRHRCDDDAFFSQAKTQVSQTWIYKSVEFIYWINFPCAAVSRILETSTGCVVVINKWSTIALKENSDSAHLRSSAMTHHYYLSIHF